MEYERFFRQTLTQALSPTPPPSSLMDNQPNVYLKVDSLGLKYIHMTSAYLHTSMLLFLKNILKKAAHEYFLPPHHLFLSFQPSHPEVAIPQFLQDPSLPHLSIVLEDNFSDLQINPRGFRVTLFFEEQPHPLFIPWGAIIRFADPSFPFDCEIEALGTRMLEEDTNPSSPRHTTTLPQLINLADFRQKKKDSC